MRSALAIGAVLLVAGLAAAALRRALLALAPGSGIPLFCLALLPASEPYLPDRNDLRRDGSRICRARASAWRPERSSPEARRFSRRGVPGILAAAVAAAGRAHDRAQRRLVERRGPVPESRPDVAREREGALRHRLRLGGSPAVPARPRGVRTRDGDLRGLLGRLGGQGAGGEGDGTAGRRRGVLRAVDRGRTRGTRTVTSDWGWSARRAETLPGPSRSTATDSRRSRTRCRWRTGWRRCARGSRGRRRSRTGAGRSPWAPRPLPSTRISRAGFSAWAGPKRRSGRRAGRSSSSRGICRPCASSPTDDARSGLAMAEALAREQIFRLSRSGGRLGAVAARGADERRTRGVSQDSRDRSLRARVQSPGSRVQGSRNQPHVSGRSSGDPPDEAKFFRGAAVGGADRDPGMAAVVKAEDEEKEHVGHDPDEDRDDHRADEEGEEARREGGTLEGLPEVAVEQPVPGEPRRAPAIVSQEPRGPAGIRARRRRGGSRDSPRTVRARRRSCSGETGTRGRARSRCGTR